MQIKKKELQESIQNTALEMFYRFGYEKTKMGSIAKELDISVGSIYTYFKNKKDLFYTVVPQDTADYLEGILSNIIKSCNNLFVNQKEFEKTHNYVSEQMKILTSNYREVVIILGKSKGTVYENVKDNLVSDLVIGGEQREAVRNLDKRMSEVEIERFFKISEIIFFEMLLMGLEEEGQTNEERYRLCMMLTVDYLKNEM